MKPPLFVPLLAFLCATAFAQSDRRETVTQAREDYRGNTLATPAQPASPAPALFVPYLPTTLPPAPPVLGAALPARSPAEESQRHAHELLLQSFVFDSFYPALAILSWADDLTSARRSELETYRELRRAAVARLRAQLDGAGAGNEADTLAALAQAAEKIHLGLLRDVAALHAVEWDRLRAGNRRRAARSPDEEELNLCFSAAFFHDGLSVEQRLLLRESALETAARLNVRGFSGASSANTIYFSPFTSRIQLPASIPVALETKIRAYQEAKAALKRELRDELLQHDLDFFTASRTNAFRSLAARQAPAFAALEQLAEEIRVALAAFPNPARPAAATLPEPLSARLSSYLVTKATWQKTMLRHIAELRAKFPDTRIELVGLDDQPRIEFRTSRGATPTALDRAALDEFNTRQLAVYTSLGREKESLDAEINRNAAADPAATRSVDEVLSEFGAALAQLDGWLRYRDYEIAVLRPGLSPAQRRLLFSDALEKLDLPLLGR